jgi:sugar lactone lactonase YvrE
MKRAPDIRCVQQANAILGEGPVWDKRTGEVFWVDIRRMHVFRLHLASGTQTGQWAFPERVGCVALTDDLSRLLVAAGLRVYWLDLESGQTTVFVDLGSERDGQRFNDGEVDAYGRFWIGTMMDDFFAPEKFENGAVHCVRPDGSVEEFGGFQLPNGIGWSLDNTLMYVNDSAAGTTCVFDFDLKTGQARNKRVIYTSDQGLPDGLSVDAEGNVWCAMWDGWRVVKLSRNGTLLDSIDMPVRRPSSATFCGERLDQLIITSATVGFTSEDFIKSPQAGGLFTASVENIGRQPNIFGQSADRAGAQS